MAGGSLREVAMVTHGFVLTSPGNMKEAMQC